MRGEPAPYCRHRDCDDRRRLAEALWAMGVQPGRDLLIHCSLRRIGAICGGAATLLAALQDATGPASTLVVPTQTVWNSLTSREFLTATAGLSLAERTRFIAGMPGFDPASTPSAGMGAFAEHMRKHPDTVRSSHPQVSFAALGPRAAACMAVHDLDCHLGERSPLGWLYAADAVILLLGVGYSSCTAFHLAEYRLLGERPLRRYHCFLLRSDGRSVCEFTGLALDDSDFELLGADLDITSPVRRGQVGSADCRLLPLRVAVDFGCAWFAAHRAGVRSC